MVKLNLWGESLLHKDLLAMISFAKKHSRLVLQFNTNARALTPAIARGLISSRLDKITISMDGINKKTYEAIRVGSNFELVMKNLKTLLDLKKKARSPYPEVTLQILRLQANAHERKRFIQYWSKKADVVTVTNIGATTADPDILKLSLRQNKEHTRIPCPQLWQRLSVFWDGTITACCGDYQGFLRLGHIGKNTLSKIWQGRKLNDLRQKHADRDFKDLICEKCTGILEFSP